MATGFSVMDALNKNSKAGIEETPKARFRTKDISIFKMYRNEMNFYGIAAIEELAGDILTFGLKQNLELVYEPCEKGEYRIVAGERRWLALKHLVSKGYKEFEMATSKLTTPQDADEEQVEIIIANAYRNKSVADMIEEEKRLKESLEKMKAAGKQIKGYDLTSGRLRDVIASMLHMSKTKVAQIESVNNNLIPEFKEELKGERLTFSAAYELSGMSEQEQKEALERFQESGELSHKDIKTMKEEKTGQQDAQNAFGEDAEIAAEGRNGAETEKSTPETENAENGANTKPEDGNEEHPAAGGDYQTPHPEGITSLCYFCTQYETCNVKTGTCTKCDQYENRSEAHKTDEQRYSEEQDRIDKETERKLRERADEERMNSIPSASGENGQRVHQIRLGESFFEDACSNVKSFELRKNDRGYKKGDILELMEFADGRNTGRMVRKLVTYIIEDYTGLEDGFCIMATSLVNKDGEPLREVDLGQICADLKENGDGYIDGSWEYILIDKAVSIVRDGGGVGALAGMVYELESAEEKENADAERKQPELPALKNNDQRKEWVGNYKDWGLWYRDENIDVNYYKFDFADGSRLVAAEYPQRCQYWNGKKADEVFYHLLEKNKQGYKKTYDEVYRHTADSETYLVEFLKKLQKKVTGRE